ncbi:MAG: S8 family serine peptidase [Saprospiraceae bacterium]|nr:S8 family serine peptidase [Saprospiraceae bacterium]
MARFTLFLTIFPLFLFAQNPKLNKYWVEFTDKNNTPYCTCRPAEFLSARALERRARAGIEVVDNDLPPTPEYLTALQYKNVQIHSVSRWLNAAAVIGDSAHAAGLLKLPFVKSVRYLGPHLKYRNPTNRPQKMRRPLASMPQVEGGGTYWGYAALQNNLLGVPVLHMAGHKGEGIHVAVMDGGFTNVDTLPFFDSLALHNRLFSAHDFVEHDGAVFEAAQHGTSVLSVMGAYLPGFFVGTAPEATYYLLKTEDTGGEYPVEETNWIAGAEWADSAGVHIINASLGYTSFNDTTLSHTYSELNGRTAIGSRGAAIAATKGMIVCNSAGNEGDGPWKYIGVPADAPGLIAVGAVQHDARRAAFSSVGPTPDGRIKPELVAPGEEVVTAGSTGTQLGVSSGTSLASPMLVGSIAALWSAFPEKTASEILDAVFASADQSQRPDNARGYGLPDMTAAWFQLASYVNSRYIFAYNRTKGELRILLPDRKVPLGATFALRNILGRKIDLTQPILSRHEISTLVFQNLENVPPGSYYVEMLSENGVSQIVTATW